MGIAFGSWEPLPWKRTLHDYAKAAAVAAEFLISGHDLDDVTFPYQGNPFSVFEHNFVLACFCIRRLDEKRMLTDRLSGKQMSFKSFPAVEDSFRTPLSSSTGNLFYQNYRFDIPQEAIMTVRDFSNEVVHSSLVGIVTEPEVLPVGILVASDWRLSRRVLHLSLRDWNDMFRTVLADRVIVASDEWDPSTDSMKVLRLSQDEI